MEADVKNIPEKLPHAIILQGDDGEARDNYKMLLSQAAVCEKSEGRPCGVCAHCVKAKKGIHPDIITVTGSGKNGTVQVSQIRELREDASLFANEAGGKMYVIPDAQLMNVQAQNALLKIFEEPPEQVSFVLICPDAQLLLPTIRSRAQIFSFFREHYSSTNEKAENIAKKLLDELKKPSEWELLKATSELEDRETLRQVCLLLRDAFFRAVRASAGGTEENDAFISSLQNTRTLRQLSALYDASDEFAKRCELNVYAALTASAFCARLYTASLLNG